MAVDQFRLNFHVVGDGQRTIFPRPYNFVTDSIHTKKLCSELSSSKVRFYFRRKTAALRF